MTYRIKLTDRQNGLIEYDEDFRGMTEEKATKVCEEWGWIFDNGYSSYYMEVEEDDDTNDTQKVIFDGSTIYFIIKTDGDQNFWYWQVDKIDVMSYFTERKRPDVVFRIASEDITKADADIFVNDIENSGIGSSVASFETIEEAINDIL